MPDTPRGGVVTLGETMVLLAGTAPGSLAHAPGVSLGIGGAESNTAIGLSRLGVPVSWIGRVGRDSFGDRVLREIRGEGVDVIAIRDEDAQTGVMVKEQRTGSMTKVWYYRRDAAGSRLSPADIPEELIANAAVLHITGITPALGPSAHQAVVKAVDIARDSGTRISFDVNYRQRLWSREQAAETLTPLLQACDIVFAGASEAQIFLPEARDVADLPALLCGFGPSQAFVKLGSEGSVAQVDGKAYAQAAVPVDAIDTVGAGDAYIAGYLAEMLAGKSVEESLHTAALVGAYACTVRSDWEGLPRREELGSELLGEQVIR